MRGRLFKFRVVVARARAREISPATITLAMLLLSENLNRRKNPSFRFNHEMAVFNGFN